MRAPTVWQLAAMVLAYLGIRISYARLVQMLGIGAYGTPGRNLLRLAALGVRVNYGPSSFTELTEHLKDGNPCIALVHTSELPYWSYATDHAVVVIGLDDESLYVNDPHFDKAPQRVSMVTLCSPGWSLTTVRQ